MMHVRLPLLSVSFAILALACSDSSGPDDETTRPPSELNILRLAGDSPPLLDAEVSFYAVKGENREGRIFFDDGQGREGDEYLRLRVDANSLLARPDGTSFAEDDSILITIRAVDPTQTLFELEPSGLRFSPDDPAELRIRYAEADDDLNEDGRVDQDDLELELRLAIWRQENPGDPFVRLGTLLVDDLDEVEAELQGFSRYALAY